MARGDRLTVVRLAQLLGIAEKHGMLLEAIFLSESSPRGHTLLSQLRYVRRKGGGGLGWNELAAIMRQVDQLAEQIDSFTHPRFMLDSPVAPTAWLRAAAEIRGQERGGRARGRMEKLAKQLERVQEADRRVEERLKKEKEARRGQRRKPPSPQARDPKENQK